MKNFRNSPVGSLWFGFKVFTVYFAWLLAVVLVISGGVAAVYLNVWMMLSAGFFGIGMYSFAVDLAKTLDKEENEDDDDYGPYYQVKF